MVIHHEKPILVLMELMGVGWGGGGLIERDPECDGQDWRMSEELECLAGNSTLLLAAVWVQLCLHVCVFFSPHQTMNSLVFSCPAHARLIIRSPLV